MIYKSKDGLTLSQLVYRLIKEAPEIKNYDWQSQKNWLLVTSDLLTLMTPREFTHIFPIEKKYDGSRWGEKDYFYVTGWIDENIGWDNKIPNGFEFLMEYLSWPVNVAAVQMMDIVGKFHQRQTGKDPLIEFFESQGIHIRYLNEE